MPHDRQTILLADDDLAEFPAHLLMSAAQGFEQFNVRGIGRVGHESVRKAGEYGGLVTQRSRRAVNVGLYRTRWGAEHKRALVKVCP